MVLTGHPRPARALDASVVVAVVRVRLAIGTRVVARRAALLPCEQPCDPAVVLAGDKPRDERLPTYVRVPARVGDITNATMRAMWGA